MSLKPRSLLLIVSLAQPHSNYQQARSDTGSSSWDEKGGLIFNQAIYPPVHGTEPESQPKQKRMMCRTSHGRGPMVSASRPISPIEPTKARSSRIISAITTRDTGTGRRGAAAHQHTSTQTLTSDGGTQRENRSLPQPCRSVIGQRARADLVVSPARCNLRSATRRRGLARGF